jgi:hypothetical protein
MKPLILGMSLMVLMSDLAYAAPMVQTAVDGQHLRRRWFSVPNNQTLTIRTTGCTGNTDSVIYLLEPVSGSSHRFTTRAYNDDYPGLGVCSRVSYTNTSGSTKNYLAVVMAYNQWSWGPVNFQQLVNGSWQTLWSSVMIGGHRSVNQSWTGGTFSCMMPTCKVNDISTNPVRMANGPIMDTIMFAMSRTPGQRSTFDDDSGVGLYASINMDPESAGACSGSFNCDLVVGGFNPLEIGKVAYWVNQGCESDCDGLHLTIENAYGLSTTLKDTDNDGIDDWQELMGVKDPAGLAGYDKSLIMPHLNSHPNEMDLYYEIDYMIAPAVPGDPGHTHQPYLGLAADLSKTFTDEFAWTGKKVHVHTFIDQSIGHWGATGFVPCSVPNSDRLHFFSIKSNPAYFDPMRLSVFHDAIAGHGIYYDSTCSITPAQGRAEQIGNDVIIALPLQHSMQYAWGIHLHELGHNLGLNHEGNDQALSGDFTVGNSCVHSSVMNYRYRGGWGNASIPVSRRVSYSRGVCDASGVSCDNSCTNVIGRWCVPQNQSSPKLGCEATPHSSDCDCDRDEWHIIELRFKDYPNGKD